jgi:hypothetical protein
VVTFEAVGEGVQVGQVVGPDGGDPRVEAVAVQAGDYLGELLNVTAQSVQVRAGDRISLSLSCSPASRLSEGQRDPAGDVTDPGLGGNGRRSRLDSDDDW